MSPTPTPTPTITMGVNPHGLPIPMLSLPAAVQIIDGSSFCAAQNIGYSRSNTTRSKVCTLELNKLEPYLFKQGCQGFYRDMQLNILCGLGTKHHTKRNQERNLTLQGCRNSELLHMSKTIMLANSILVHVLDDLLGMTPKVKVFRSISQRGGLSALSEMLYSTKMTLLWLFLVSSLRGRRIRSSSSPKSQKKLSRHLLRLIMKMYLWQLKQHHLINNLMILWMMHPMIPQILWIPLMAEDIGTRRNMTIKP
jgi:hypothetical protein